MSAYKLHWFLCGNTIFTMFITSISLLECTFWLLLVFVTSLKPAANKASQNINYCLKEAHMPKAIINIGRYNGTLTEYTKEGK